jgi:hypothetical protein
MSKWLDLCFGKIKQLCRGSNGRVDGGAEGPVRKKGVCVCVCGVGSVVHVSAVCMCVACFCVFTVCVG